MKYLVKPTGRGEDAGFAVRRENERGQGWQVAVYRDIETAALVARFLERVSDTEIR